MSMTRSPPKPPSSEPNWWASFPPPCSSASPSNGGRRSTSTPRGRSRPASPLRGRGVPRAAGQGPLAAEAATLPLAEPVPNAELLAVHEGVLEAILPHHAPPADGLGLSRRSAALRKEQVGVD